MVVGNQNVAEVEENNCHGLPAGDGNCQQTKKTDRGSNTEDQNQEENKGKGLSVRTSPRLGQPKLFTLPDTDRSVL